LVWIPDAGSSDITTLSMSALNS